MIAAGAVYPVFEALTSTATLAPLMYAASAGTLTVQVAVPASSAEVVVSVSPPISTVTPTPASVPVSPPISNPAAFSAMFTVPSPAIAPRVSASAPAACTVTV